MRTRNKRKRAELSFHIFCLQKRKNDHIASNCGYYISIYDDSFSSY